MSHCVCDATQAKAGKAQPPPAPSPAPLQENAAAADYAAIDAEQMVEEEEDVRVNEVRCVYD